MKKFNVNINGNFNIYGEIIPINAFYGKIGNTLYYCCDTRKPSQDALTINGIIPLNVYVWQGDFYGWVRKVDYGIIAQTIYTHAEKNKAWNTGVKRDVCYGMGRTIAQKTNFMTQVTRNHKVKSIKDGSKYAANHRHKNKGEVPLNVGECIISRTFNTGRSISYKE